MHCRRSIFHVMFWKKSQFCTTLETVLTYIETMFDGAHGQFLKRIGQMLDINRLLQQQITLPQPVQSAVPDPNAHDNYNF